MVECVVRMEMPKEGCHTCDARCVSALYGYICGIERKNVMPFLGKKNRPDWCPIICAIPEGHGDLIDRDVLLQTFQNSDYETYNDYCEAFDTTEAAEPIVPAAAERSEHERTD